MIRIKQDDRTGCGLACIAMLAKTSYNNVRNVAIDKLEFNDSGKFYTNKKHLRKLGNHFNIKIAKKKKKFTNFETLPDIAILAINYKKKSKTWHWVIYNRDENEEYICDPKESIKSDKRKDFWRIGGNTKWFLVVEKT